MNVYGFEFVMKNLVSSPFAKMTSAITSGFDAAEKKNKAFQNSINDTQKLMNAMASKMRSLEVKRTIAVDDKAIKKADNALDKLRKRQLELAKGLKPSVNTPDDKPSGSSGMLGLMSNPYLAAGLAATYAVRQVIGSASALSDKGYQYDKTRFGITQYTGDAGTSERYIDKIAKTGTGKMFGSDAITGFQQALLGFKDAQKSFEFVTEKLSNISAGTGNSIAELAGIQMKTRMQGYVQMDEAQQWSERKIPLLEYLSKATGLNSQKLLKAIEQRQVKTEMFDKALTMMSTGTGIFANMTNKASQTGFGQKLGFENTMDLKLQQAGNKFNEMFSNKFYAAGNSFFAQLEKQEPKMKAAFDNLALRMQATDKPLNELRDGLTAGGKAANVFASLLTGLANMGVSINNGLEYLDRAAAKSHLERDFTEDKSRLQRKQLADNFGINRFPLFRNGKESENLAALHRRESKAMEADQSRKRLMLENQFKDRDTALTQADRAAKFGTKAQERRNLRKGLSHDGTKKTDSVNATTDAVGKGLGSAATTGGGVKNITLNISSLINQVQMIKENGKGLDTDQIRRILHEELTATIASAVMMGSGN
jgi:tape measure domain-containing protein